MTTFAEATEDPDLIENQDEQELGQGEIQFNTTGVKHRDMAIAGMINDAPNACKELVKNKNWEEVCNSPNPAGAAELALLTILGVPTNKLKPVLIKLKTLLAGINMTIPQAFHKCVITDQLNRINIDSINSVTTPIEKEIVSEPIKVETPIKTLILNGKILTNVDGTTYEFGHRGRRPLWVQDWLKTNSEPT